MKGIIKKCIISIILILVIIIMAVIITHYISSNEKRGKKYYIDAFHNNQSLFEELSNSLMQSDYEMNIDKESGEIFVFLNRKTIKLTDYSLDEKTKSNIKKAINKIGGGCSIYKSPTILQFDFNTNFNGHCIAYATDIKELDYYTSVEQLVGNWYYCFTFHE